MDRNDLTDRRILELATYYFFEDKVGKWKWSGSNDGVIGFARAIQDKQLEGLIANLENLRDSLRN